MAWELRRQIDSDSNGYERTAHDVGGSAVLYEHAGEREIEVYINGTAFTLAFPDTSEYYGGDPGRPVAYRLRFEAGHWYCYAYIFSGDNNRSEWMALVL